LALDSGISFDLFYYHAQSKMLVFKTL